MGNVRKAHAVRCVLLTASALASCGWAGGAMAQAAPEDGASPSQSGVQEIIVTAEKREQKLTKVPMSITAVSSEALKNAGVAEVRDLAKVTPGFKYADSLAGTPVFSLRGVGFDDIALAGRPTVSTYIDQAPVPFAIETYGVSLDLERVEVLKGPQGTLFGNNATGGAINFIAAKPTNTFQAGIDAGIGNYNSHTVGGFVSGPLTDTLRVRVAAQHDGMGEWQKAYTFDGKTGKKDFLNTRLSLEWEPVSNLKASLVVNHWVDRSDTQATYLLGVAPNNATAVPLYPDIFNYPLPPRRNDTADFIPGRDFAKNNRYTSIAGRLDWKATDALTVTSLSVYNKYDGNQTYNTAGLSTENNVLNEVGKLRTFSQELRAALAVGNVANITVGGYYQHDTGRESNTDFESHSTLSNLFDNSALTANFPDFFAGSKKMLAFGYSNNQNDTTKALFASGDVNVTSDLKLYGGIRYTKFDVDFWGCSSDTGDGTAGDGFSRLANFLLSANGLPAIAPIAPGACFTLDSGTHLPGMVYNQLHEDNVSWRAGAQWQATPDLMLYANVSRGFKAGGFPTILATVSSQEVPAKQEQLTAYEAGFKATLLNRTLQVTGAGFYYNYKDKQILGRTLDPFAGPITVLVNIPKSRIVGAELQANWVPVHGLNINVGGSYIDSKILKFEDFDPNGVKVSFAGEAFPNAPKWHLVGDMQYELPVSDKVNAFAGVNASYESSTNGQLGEIALLQLPAYALVDLRAGVKSQDDNWKVWAWVRNVGNQFYLTSANRLVDTTTAYTGMPRTFGASLSVRIR